MSDHYGSRREMARYIWTWDRGGDSFSSVLLTMISKADVENLARLKIGFREMVAFYDEWQRSPSGEKFLEHEMRTEASE